MTCEGRRDVWVLYAAGALEPDLCGRLEQHLKEGCPRCSRRLADAWAVVQGRYRPRGGDSRPTGAVRESLMSRVRGGRADPPERRRVH